MSHAEDALTEIEACAVRRGLTQHPFFLAWTAGELDRNSLRQFATQNFQNVDAFSRHASLVHSRASSADTRIALLGLLNAIEGEDTPSQGTLWLRFCASLGLFSESVRNADRTPQTQACLDTFTALCLQSTVAGLAGLHAYYHLTPDLTRLQLAGLTQHYGMSDGAGRQYFEARTYAAPHHSHRLRDALAALMVDGATAGEAVSATDRALDALYDLVTGVATSVAADLDAETVSEA